MAEVKVKFSSTAYVKKVWLDGVRIGFDGNGEFLKNLQDGRKHVLQWIVRGAPAETYSISVVSPKAIAAQLATNELLGPDKIGFGQYEFNL